jgi:glucokinase
METSVVFLQLIAFFWIFPSLYKQQGYGCLTLHKDEVRPLFGPGDVEQLPDGPKVCIGAGTGLGECYLTPDSDDSTAYTCYPSEGGHVEFAPRNDLEVEMFKFLNDKFCSKDRISVERVVSGKGLANVYDFLAQKYPTRIVKEVHEEFLKANDEQGKVVATNATEGSLCKQVSV